MFDLSKLGVVKNVPKVNFVEYCGIIIAPPKFGKTTLASMYPNSVVVPFEKGYKAQVVNIVENIDSWDDFIKFVDKLEKHRSEIGDAIQNIIFDTVNKAYELVMPYALSELSRLDSKKYLKPSDVPHGQVYPAIDRYFQLQIDRLVNMGFNPVFLSHNALKTIKPKNGEPYDIYVSTMPERCEKIIYPLCDYIIHGERKKIVNPKTGNSEMKRVMIIQGEEEGVNAGSRVYLNANIDFDTEAEAMEKFQAVFRKQIEQKLSKAGVTESLDTIAEKQNKERLKKAQEYIDQNKNTELVNKLNKLCSENKGDTVKMSQFQELLQKYKITSLANPDDIKKEILLDLISVFQ